MVTVEMTYYASWGDGDCGEHMTWDAELTDEEYAIYKRDLQLQKDPNEDDRLEECLDRINHEIAVYETELSVENEDCYALECTGREPADPEVINTLVRDRDPYTLELLHLEELSEEELDKWDANDLEVLPNVCDIDPDFDAINPYEEGGWSIRVFFKEPVDDITEDEVKETLAMLFAEKDYEAIREYIDAVNDCISDEFDIEKMVEEMAKELGVLEEYEG